METKMRLFLAALIALGGLAALPDHADARKKPRAPYAYRDYGPPPAYRNYRRAPPPYGYRYRQTEDPNSSVCIEAEALDPGGNYAGYPCWARRAFAPKKEF